MKIDFKDSDQGLVIDGLAVSLTPCQLPSSRVYVLAPDRDEPDVYEIEDTSYSIHTSRPLRHFPGMVKQTLDDVFTPHYRLSVSSVDDGISYDCESDREWTLTALRIAHQWQPFGEAILQRGKNHVAGDPG
jgi:hypothetical protein